MSADLQKRFKELAQGERVYVGGKLATQNDLCALFTARAVANYLRSAGRLAFVLPMAALTRGQFEKLRSGSFHSGKIQWDETWMMDDSVQPLFPVPSCVVFGRRRAIAKAMPDTVLAYSGTLPLRDAHEDVANTKLKVTKNSPKPIEATFTGGSIYRTAFRQGATLVPRVLCFVERREMGRLGSDPSAPAIQSRRSSQEKQPWKSLTGVEGRVEVEFLRPVLLGESILPFHVFHALEGVIPATQKGEILDSKGAQDRGFDHLAGWMRKVEEIWKDNAESTMTLVERWNYHNELGAQFPLAPLRVVYAKAGTLPAACVLRDPKYVIDHKLYWSAHATLGEAHYLSSILNSETARKRSEARQSRGQWGARDFDKVVFNLPIPRFDTKIELHRDLAAAAAKAEKIASTFELPENIKFQRARGLVRNALVADGVAATIDDLVERLLDGDT
jgi:hypothetical protein